ncbi:MAG: 5-(carboxyamino)imidazole ribonucleotide synthase, partial [Bryobacteraceae bacterium]
TAPYSDLDAVREFARNVAVVTFEFENVPAETAAAAAEFVPVRPAGKVLHVTQNRLREQTVLQAAGFPVTPFRPIQSLSDLREGMRMQGGACVLKTAGFGYDGKGQVRVPTIDHADAAWDAIARAPAVLESLVDFESEVSVIAARGSNGCFAHYGVVENRHTRQILDVTIAPATAEVSKAVSITREILEALELVGVLCVEFFLNKDGKLLINELAPRPHNSGHFSVDACVTDQFEQQLRAVCDLPLGSTEQVRPAAMANLLGDLWRKGEPNWAAACAFAGVKLHLYGKLTPRAGRKMGHLTALGADAEVTVLAARKALTAHLT